MSTEHHPPQPVIRRVADFNLQSGNRAERLLFNHRRAVVAVCLLATLLLGWCAGRLGLNANFEKTIPTTHPYVVNYLRHRNELGGMGNAVRVAVETRAGDIYQARYLDTLRKISDELFLLPGVDRAFLKSLWTPATRWSAVTEDGLDGGTVIPDDYDGSPRSLAQVRVNVARSGETGQLVAADGRSSVVLVPLLERDPQTGAALDYRRFAQQVALIRQRYDSATLRLRVTGFAEIAGDMIAGLRAVMGFFALAVALIGAALYWYTRCWRSTLLVVGCSLVAVLWQLGLLAALGYQLDPYSVLVPFLVFAIGVSHGAQKMNGIMQDIGRGTHRLVAARYTFRRLFAAGLTALLCDAAGFGVLAIIPVQAIRELALIAGIGVAALIFTNLVLLPILLSYVGVSPAAAARSVAAPGRARRPGAAASLWRLLDRFTRTRWALGAIGAAAALALAGLALGQRLQVGDLDPGAPELRADSRYNRDSAFMVRHYAASADILVVMVQTAPGRCLGYAALALADRLSWRLEQLPGVEASASMAALARRAAVGYNEGNFKWDELIPNAAALGGARAYAPPGWMNPGCSLLALSVYLADHKAATLARVTGAVQAFAARHDDRDTRFLLVAGNAGIEAATNIVVRRALREMLYWVYGVVTLLCYLAFRSWRAVLVAVLPLMLTSVLCEALMVLLGMGVKVATLPAIALGVGIGVDYALYVLSVMLSRLKAGDGLSEAYLRALEFTGRVVLLTGCTLALAVATWVCSPIRFQADMGLLLAFMFLWNMLGALVLMPALARFVLPAAARAGRAAAPRPAALAAQES